MKKGKNMNNIDIQKIEDFIKLLNENELLYLNRLVVERIKILSQVKSSKEMLRFNIGDKVCFTLPEGELKKGLIIKINKKTASIQTQDGQNWKVSPELLKHV